MDEEPDTPTPTQCVECHTATEDLDEHGQCIDCSPELDAPIPVCRECGDDDGPYDGLCLDCLEKEIGSLDSHIDEPGDVPW